MVSTKAKIDLLRQIEALKKKKLSYREISKEMGKAEAWAGVFWRRHKHLLKTLDTKPDTILPEADTKSSTPPPPATPPSIPKVREQFIPVTAEDLRVMFQVYLHANPNDEDVQHIRPKVSTSWGGSLQGGGGWSGAIMRTLAIVAKMELKIKK